MTNVWQPVDQASSALGAKLMSSYRVSEGLHPLVVLPSLQAPAEAKAIDMATRDYAAHEDPPGGYDAPAGRSWFTRDEAYGYVGALGEVIDWGTDYVLDSSGQIVTVKGEPQTVPMSPASAIKGWTSIVGEEHWQTIHIADYTACGYAVANDKSGEAFHICVLGIAPVSVPPTSKPPVTPPTPIPAPPANGTHWRLKANPFAKPITMLGYVNGRVLAQNKKGQALDPILLLAFFKKYTQV